MAAAKYINAKRHLLPNPNKAIAVAKTANALAE
jgi:hypothetical protein